MTKPIFLPDGIFTAPLTPLNKDLSIDHQTLADHCKWLLANGTNGLALMGTTGEANSFTTKERMEALDAVIQAGIPANQIMVGTGCCAFPDSVALTRHAMQHQLGGVLLLPPFYYKQVTEEGIVKSFDLLINQVNDENLRIYLYHFPKMSGIPFSISLIKRLIKAYPGIIVGIKDSSGDWNNMQQMCQEIPDFKVYAGTERFLLNILEAGGAGCISATANVTTRLLQGVYQAWKNNKGEAEALQSNLTKVRSAFEGLPFTGALKGYLANQTRNAQWQHVRPPNTLIEEQKLAILEDQLKELAFAVPS